MVADPEELREAVLSRSAEDIDAPAWRVWFECTIPVAFGDAVLTIAVPNPLADEYIRTRFKPALEKHLRALRGEEWGIEIVVAEDGGGA